MQQRSSHTSGSRLCSATKRARHACSASHLSLGSSDHEWLMKQSTSPKPTLLVRACSVESGALVEIHEKSTRSSETARKEAMALSCACCTEPPPPMSAAIAAAVVTASPRLASHDCAKRRKRVGKMTQPRRKISMRTMLYTK